MNSVVVEVIPLNLTCNSYEILILWPPLPSPLLQNKLALEAMQTEFRAERQARADGDVLIGQLELQIKKLQANLHVSEITTHTHHIRGSFRKIPKGGQKLFPFVQCILTYGKHNTVLPSVIPFFASPFLHFAGIKVIRTLSLNSKDIHLTSPPPPSRRAAYRRRRQPLERTSWPC